MAARRILTADDEAFFVSPSSDGRYLVFSPYSDLFVRDLREGTNRRLTSRETEGDYADVSVVSPDSRQVAYAWFDNTAGRWFLNSNFNPAWSPDGQSLAYLSRRRPGRGGDSLALVIRSVKSGEEREVPMKIRPAHALSPLRWFPDGRSLLVPSRNELQRRRLGYYRVDLGSGNAELLHRTRTYNRATRQTDLSPDGKSIFYLDGDAASASSSAASQLMRFDIDSGYATELKRATSGGFGSLSVSPDGRQLAYLRYDRPTRSRVLKVIPATGGEARELFRENGEAPPLLFSGLACTPDQRYLLFVRPESNPADPPDQLVEPTALWRVPVTGGQPDKTGMSMGGWVRIIRLHPDGRRLAFSLRHGGGSREVWALENFLPQAGAGR